MSKDLTTEMIHRACETARARIAADPQFEWNGSPVLRSAARLGVSILASVLADELVAQCDREISAVASLSPRTPNE